MTEGTITLTKAELDGACKDKKNKLFKKDFCVELTFEAVGDYAYEDRYIEDEDDAASESDDDE